MQTMLEVFNREKKEWLEECRAAARKLLCDRPFVTIEDVLKECPRPKHIHPNITGHVFNDTDFKPVGWLPSKRPAMNGRYVRTWRLA